MYFFKPDDGANLLTTMSYHLITDLQRFESQIKKSSNSSQRKSYNSSQLWTEYNQKSFHITIQPDGFNRLRILTYRDFRVIKIVCLSPRGFNRHLSGKFVFLQWQYLSVHQTRTRPLRSLQGINLCHGSFGDRSSPPVLSFSYALRD